MFIITHPLLISFLFDLFDVIVLTFISLLLIVMNFYCLIFNPFILLFMCLIYC